MASLDNRLNTNTCDTHAAADRQRTELEKVQTDGAKRGIRDGGAAERKIEFAQVGAAKSKDFGCGVGEGAAKRLIEEVNMLFS